MINKEEIELINLIKTIDQEVKSTYGRKRMTIEVAKRCGIKYNEKKIRRIMIEEDRVCLIRAKKKRFKKSSDEYFRDNVLNRDFSTTKDNQKWSTDITEINTLEGKLYISGIIDMNSKMIISYEIGDHNNNELVIKTFKKININDVDILQSDRGFQYTSYMFKNITKDITHSMSRPGHCPDNSPIESFWGIFKSECYYNKLNKDKFRTKEEAIKTIKEYIEFYNKVRINLKGTTPYQIRYNSLNY